MNLFFIYCAFSVMTFLLVYLYRSVKGPSTFDRVIGLLGISTNANILMIILGILSNRLDMFIDICLGYVLLNLVGSLAIAKYLQEKNVADREKVTK